MAGTLPPARITVGKIGLRHPGLLGSRKYANHRIDGSFLRSGFGVEVGALTQIDPLKREDGPPPASDRKTIFIGTADANDLVIAGRGVSKRHCKITTGDDGSWLIEDLGSTNGTFVNGTKVTDATPVSRQDHITLGPLQVLEWQQVEKQFFDATEDLSTLQTITVGSDRDNDVVLDYPMVSRQHLRILQSGGKLLVEDLNSTNGTALNRRDNLIRSAEVSMDDMLYLGVYRVPVRQLVNPKRRFGNQDSETVTFEGEPLIIGRSPNADVVIDHPAISLRHLKVVKGPSGIEVTDLNSMNGTFVNGQRIKGSRIISPEDELTLGVYQVKLDMRGVRKLDLRDRFTLVADDISLEVPAKGGRKTLLDRISFCVYPGEFCGLMGTSGAGKTTLLRTALGYYKPSGGVVRVNGKNLHTEYDRFRTSLGYVPQEDIMHADLTVEQSLTYSAKLRLGNNLSGKEIDDRINNVLSDLGLFTSNPEIRTTRISQISGGQRRRVNMAIELLVDPSIFFLDEPTSGLSSQDALEVMTMLRRLSDMGKIVLLTLHQPSLEAYKLMDNIIFLHKGGRMAYFGATYPDSLAYTNPHLSEAELTTPDLALSALEKKAPEQWQRDYQTSTQYSQYVTQRLQTCAFETEEAASRKTGRGSFLRQWRILTTRNVRIKLQDTMNTAILLLQAPIIALLITLICGQEGDAYDVKYASIALFLMVVSAIWFGCSNAARDICGEWHIYQRERMYNLNLAAYTLSKITTSTLVCAIQCAMLVPIVALTCNLKAPLGQLFGMVLTTALAGAALGLLVSAFASPFKKRTEIAIAIIPLLLIPIVVLGGVIKPLKEMGTTAETTAATMISRWAFEGLLHLEAQNLDTPETPDPEAQGSGAPEAPSADAIGPGMQTPQPPAALSPSDRMVWQFFDLEKTVEIHRVLTILAGFFLLFLAGTMVLLKRQDII